MYLYIYRVEITADLKQRLAHIKNSPLSSENRYNFDEITVDGVNWCNLSKIAVVFDNLCFSIDKVDLAISNFVAFSIERHCIYIYCVI